MMTRLYDTGTDVFTSSLKDLATGRGVKRAKHELVVDGNDYTREFIKILHENGFAPVTVRDAPIEPGERIPAFYIKDSTAYFGWIFFEKFTTQKMRKLWGSVIRDQKGDWAIQISPRKNIKLYAEVHNKSQMDLDHPTGW